MNTSFFPILSRVVPAAAVFSILAAAALAQAPAPGAPAAPAGAAPAAAPAKPLSVTDKKFVKDAGKSVYYLLQLNAAAKTVVTDTGRTSMRDKTNGNLNSIWESLGKYATAHGETLPQELSGGDKSDVERLGKLKDDKFEKQWLGDMVKESKRLVQSFEGVSKSAQDPDLKTFAANYTPMMKSVFSAVEGAEKGLGKKK